MAKSEIYLAAAKNVLKNFAQISDTNVKRKIYVTLRLDYFNPRHTHHCHYMITTTATF